MSGLLPTPSTLMAPDYLKLFMDKRLSVDVPHHLEYIKGRLANMKIEDPAAYETYSAHYGVEVEAKVTRVTATASTVLPAKRGRPAKSSNPS